MSVLRLLVTDNEISPRDYFRDLRSHATDYRFELILLLFCWLPYYLIQIDIPPRADGFDAHAIASFSHRVATGTSVFAFPDPPFRYLIQAAAITITGIGGYVTHQEALFITQQFTILVEGLISPIALYIFVRRINSRSVALGALAVLAIIQFPFAPWIPYITFPDWVIALRLGIPTICDGCKIAPLGYAQYFADHPAGYWHYAYSIPPILAAFALTNGDDNNNTHTAILVGGFLGIAAGLEVIQAGLAALVVGVTLLWDVEYRKLAITVLSAILVSVPTFIVVVRHPKHYFGFGASQVTPRGQVVGIAAALLVMLLVFILVVAAVAYVGQRRDQWPTVGRWGWNAYRIHKVAIVASVVLLTISFAGLLVATAKVYTQSIYIHKFIAAYWGGVLLQSIST